ncbi:MAG: hypothetical protein H7138_12335 [Myxococcales bacterium]|nr:hypothetical protein [Myxococcales bacterium]
MKWTALVTFTLLLAVARAPVALAQDYNINAPKSYATQAEDAFKAGDIGASRFKLNMLEDEIRKATDSMKKDPEYPRLQARAKALEAKLAPLEAAAGKEEEADEPFRKAATSYQVAKLKQDDNAPEEAVAIAKDCVAQLEQAFQISASMKNKQLQTIGSPTGLQALKTCKEIIEHSSKVASGEIGDKASDTAEGKFVITSINALNKATKEKVPDAKTMAEAQAGVDECRTKASFLSSHVNLYRGKAGILHTDVGDLTLNEADQKCSKWGVELQNKKARGCGKRAVNVQQTLIASRTWGPIEAYAQTHYEYLPCGEMPKKSRLPKAHEARFKKLCGGKAIYVIEDSSWSVSGTTRRIGGSCYDKGDLYIKNGTAMVKGG